MARVALAHVLCAPEVPGLPIVVDILVGNVDLGLLDPRRGAASPVPRVQEEPGVWFEQEDCGAGARLAEPRDQLVVPRRPRLLEVLRAQEEVLDVVLEQRRHVTSADLVARRALYADPAPGSYVIDRFVREPAAQSDALPPAFQRESADGRQIGAAKGTE
jgi:hypothetical protein